MFFFICKLEFDVISNHSCRPLNSNDGITCLLFSEAFRLTLALWKLFFRMILPTLFGSVFKQKPEQDVSCLTPSSKSQAESRLQVPCGYYQAAAWISSPKMWVLYLFHSLLNILLAEVSCLDQVVLSVV